MKETPAIALSIEDLRAVTGFAAACAEGVLDVFERAHPDDPRPREAIDAAWAFARGGSRDRALRGAAWAAQKAASGTVDPAAREAALAAMSAAGAAFLHPLATATQVRHILGPAARAARAVELIAGDDRVAGAEHLEHARRLSTPDVVDVLRRYPDAPGGGGRVGELLRDLDQALRRMS